MTYGMFSDQEDRNLYIELPEYVKWSHVIIPGLSLGASCNQARRSACSEPASQI